MIESALRAGGEQADSNTQKYERTAYPDGINRSLELLGRFELPDVFPQAENIRQ